MKSFLVWWKYLFLLMYFISEDKDVGIAIKEHLLYAEQRKDWKLAINKEPNYCMDY